MVPQRPKERDQVVEEKKRRLARRRRSTGRWW